MTSSEADVSAFISVATPASIWAGATLLGFFIMRRKNATRISDAIYHPRSSPAWKDDSVRQLPPPLPDNPLYWLTTVLSVREKFIMRTVSLDSVVFLRFLKCAFQIFFCCGLLALMILIPVYATAERNNFGFDRLSLANVDDGSTRLWACVVFMYIFTGIICFFLNRTYMRVLALTFHHRRQLTRDNEYVVMVSNVPNKLRTDKAFNQYFQNVFGDQFAGGIIARQTRFLDSLLTQWEKNQGLLEHAEAVFKESGKRPKHIYIDPKASKKCCGKKPQATVDSIEFYSNELLKLRRQIYKVRRNPFQKTRTGFAVFKTLFAASCVSNSQVSRVPNTLTACIAPDVDDIYWSNLAVPAHVKTIRTIITTAGLTWLTLFWAVIVSVIQTFTSLENLSDKVAFLQFLNDMDPAIKSIIQGLLPTIALLALMSLLPIIIRSAIILQGVEAESWIELKAMSMLFFFQTFNVFLISTISGSITSSISKIISDWQSVFSLLATALPSQASFYIQYIMLGALGSFPSELAQLQKHAITWFKVKYRCKTENEVKGAVDPGDIDYADQYSQHLLFWVIGISYMVISPIILPFSAMYFGIAYLVYKHQIVYLYSPSYDSNGKFWPRCFNYMCTGMNIGHVTMIGVMTLKQSFIQSVLMIFLFLITSLFRRHHNEYYERFLLGPLPLEVCREADDKHLDVREFEKKLGEELKRAGGDEEENYDDYESSDEEEIEPPSDIEEDLEEVDKKVHEKVAGAVTDGAKFLKRGVSAGAAQLTKGLDEFGKLLGTDVLFGSLMGLDLKDRDDVCLENCRLSKHPYAPPNLLANLDGEGAVGVEEAAGVDWQDPDEAHKEKEKKEEKKDDGTGLGLLLDEPEPEPQAPEEGKGKKKRREKKKKKKEGEEEKKIIDSERQSNMELPAIELTSARDKTEEKKAQQAPASARVSPRQRSDSVTSTTAKQSHKNFTLMPISNFTKPRGTKSGLNTPSMQLSPRSEAPATPAPAPVHVSPVPPLRLPVESTSTDVLLIHKSSSTSSIESSSSSPSPRPKEETKTETARSVASSAVPNSSRLPTHRTVGGDSASEVSSSGGKKKLQRIGGLGIPIKKRLHQPVSFFEAKLTLSEIKEHEIQVQQRLAEMEALKKKSSKAPTSPPLQPEKDLLVPENESLTAPRVMSLLERLEVKTNDVPSVADVGEVERLNIMLVKLKAALQEVVDKAASEHEDGLIVDQGDRQTSLALGTVMEESHE